MSVESIVSHHFKHWRGAGHFARRRQPLTGSAERSVIDVVHSDAVGRQRSANELVRVKDAPGGPQQRRRRIQHGCELPALPGAETGTGDAEQGTNENEIVGPDQASLFEPNVMILYYYFVFSLVAMQWIIIYPATAINYGYKFTRTRLRL